MNNVFTPFLLPALLLPALFWPQGPETAPALRSAGIVDIAVPAAQAGSWKTVTAIKTQSIDLHQLTKAATPTVNFRTSNASATREPWVDSNGWRFLRQPGGRFHYDVPGKAAALAAAEAYAYGVQAVVKTDEAGLKPFGEMIRFLQSLPPGDAMPALFNFEYVDDGSPAAGEFMNLLVRTNLLFRVVKEPGSSGGMTVALGSAEYPKSEAGNPKLLAEKVRAHLTDEKRLLRVYGSDVVIGRLVGSEAHTRLFLLNYGAGHGGVDGIRVRVLGNFARQQMTQFQAPGTTLLDYKTGSGATEFTLAHLPVFAVIDLQR